MLDFGVLIQPVDLSKYNHIPLPTADIWGILMRKDSPLARYPYVRLQNLQNHPLLLSGQLYKKNLNNDLKKWFNDKFETLNIVATYNLIYNAAVLVKAGIGYALSLDKLADTSGKSALCFRPLEPRVEAKWEIVWNKFQIRSAAANLFLQKLQERFLPPYSITPQKSHL